LNVPTQHSAPRGDETVWDEREGEHLRRAVMAAPVHEEPSPHLYVENVFSPQAYAAILDLFPTTTDAFHRWRSPNDGAPRFANYDLRWEINIPDEAYRLPPRQRAFWSAMADVLCAPAFARTLLERFPDYARARFGALLDDPSFVEERLAGTMILNAHEPGYYLGPHSDRGEKVFTVLLYFPEHEGLDRLGTTLYRPLRRGFTCDGRAHYDPAEFEPIATMPYRPNSAFIFARTDVMFHGVEALSADELRGSRRRGIQMQFWLRNERPRYDCATTLLTEFAATMRAGEARSLAYRLTNRAAVELASSHPNVTNLGYRWIDAEGVTVQSGATELPGSVAPGASLHGELGVVAPALPGRYVLRISVVQDGIAWFDDIDPDNGAAGRVTVWDAGRRAAPAGEIFTDAGDLALGSGWYPLEREGERAFRWVENDAAVHVAALRPVQHALCMLVEPGPGVAPQPLRLSARIEGGGELGTATLRSTELVRFALPPASPAVFTVVLSAAGGGRQSPNDARVLNFRVFEMSVERSADVFPAWAVPQRGFYPLEGQGGPGFRWVCGDAVIAIGADHGDALRFDVEPGPGVGSRPFVLHAAGPGGSEILRAEIGGRTTVDVPLAALAGADVLTLRAEGGGRVIAGDPRTLDYRIFAAGG
jgi:hypothetical protein